MDSKQITNTKDKANVLSKQFESVFNEKISNDLPDIGPCDKHNQSGIFSHCLKIIMYAQ